MHRLRLAVAVSTFLLAGCSSPTESDPTVNGQWDGSNSGISVTVNLVQTGVAVTGAGTIFSPIGDYPFTLTGTFVKPSLSTILTVPGYANMSFAGTLDGNTLNGTLNGNGLVAYPVTLTR
jgi:hypothetical protein